jgi:hypothetical protein
VDPCERKYDLGMRIRPGLAACHAGLAGKPMKNFPSMFNLDAFANLAKRMHGSREKDSWDRVFPPGKHLWTALTSLHDYIENFHTGGGLCRPIFAEFLREAAQTLQEPRLESLAAKYSEIGRLWTDMANAALPQDVPLMKRAQSLLVRKATRPAADEIRRIWDELSELSRQASESFPLSPRNCQALQKDLQERLKQIHEKEVAARDELGDLSR